MLVVIFSCGATAHPSLRLVSGYLCSWSQTPAEAWEGVHLDVVFTQPADRSNPPRLVT